MDFWSRLAQAWTPDLDDTVRGSRGEADGEYRALAGHDLYVTIELPVGTGSITLHRRAGRTDPRRPQPAADREDAPALARSAPGERTLVQDIGRVDKLRGDTLIARAELQRGTATQELAALCLTLVQRDPERAQPPDEGQQTYSVESRWSATGTALLTIAVHLF